MASEQGESGVSKLKEVFEAKYDEQARGLNVRQFAELHHQLLNIRLWGNPSTYTCVTVDGVDYLWNITDGKYDGWDRRME